MPKEHRDRSYVPVDDRRHCIVAGCWGRFRYLDINGMCDPKLWDESHLAYAYRLLAALMEVA